MFGTRLGATVLTQGDHANDVEAVTWSPDGKRIALASYGVYIWQAG